MKVYMAKDGTPVAVGHTDWRKSHRYGGRKPKKEELRRKGLMAKIPKSEIRLLTMKQREGLSNFVEAGLDPAKKNECAIAAGYSPNGNPGQAIDNVLQKPFIRQRIAEALEKAGVGYEKIAEVIAEGLEAEHPTAEPRVAEDGSVTIPKDYNAIARFLREAIDLHDLRPETKIRQQVDKRTVTIHLTAADNEALEKYRRMRQEAALETGNSGS